MVVGGEQEEAGRGLRLGRGWERHLGWRLRREGEKEEGRGVEEGELSGDPGC